jgi:hypothetical protein
MIDDTFVVIQDKKEGTKSKPNFYFSRTLSSFFLHRPIPIGHMFCYHLGCLFGSLLPTDGFYEIAFGVYVIF